MHFIIRALSLVSAVCLLSGCYVLQAAQGQMAISMNREPIEELVRHPDTPAKLKDRLEYVSAAREFASRELGLPDNDSYRSYVDVGRRFVVWNVFAAEEFSIEPRQWCFPIAGCVVYRGYFSERAAERYAQRLRIRGHDAMTAGVAAYSTLGHFADPVLNTMMGWDDAQLAATLFHELAHQVVYVKDDSEFNEAFATVVEEEGIRRWLQHTGRSGQLEAWRLRKHRSDEFHALLLAARTRLQAIYAAGLPVEEMRERKRQEFGRLKAEYWQLRMRWNGYSGYDAWFDRLLGNAHLVPIATYQVCVPGFDALLRSRNNDLQRFYDDVKSLAGLPRAERRRRSCDFQADQDKDPPGLASRPGG